jgi:lysophospholipase L1-like esterase
MTTVTVVETFQNNGAVIPGVRSRYTLYASSTDPYAPGYVPASDYTWASSIDVTSDASGVTSVSLEPNINITIPAGTVYRIDTTLPDGTTMGVRYITVATTPSTQRVEDILTTVPASLVQSGAAALVAAEAVLRAAGDVGAVSFVPIGDSITIGKSVLHPIASPTLHSEASWATQASIISRGRLMMIYNAGVAADTTTLMLARFATDVVAKAPKICGIMGGTNDIGLSGGSAGTWSIATTASNIVSMVGLARAAGIVPFICTITPRVDYPADVAKLNGWIRDYCQRAKVICVDAYRPMVTASTGALASGGYLGDGLHPKEVDAVIIGQQVVTDIEHLLGRSGPYLAPYNSDPLNLIPSACFTDALTSSHPPSWVQVGSLTGYTASTETPAASDNLEGNWFQVVADGTGASCYWNYHCTTGFSVGDTVSLAYRFQVAADWTVQPWRAYVAFTGTASGLFTTYDWIHPVDGTAYMQTTVPASTTALDFYVSVPALGKGTVKIGQPTLRNLTTTNWSQYG